MSSGAPRSWAMSGRACREAEISRALFYRWHHRLERYGVDGVHPRRYRAHPGRPVELAPETERLLLRVAVSAATWGAGRIAAYVGRHWGLRVAPSTPQGTEACPRHCRIRNRALRCALVGIRKREPRRSIVLCVPVRVRSSAEDR